MGFFQVLAAQSTPNIHLGMPAHPLDIQFIPGKGGSGAGVARSGPAHLGFQAYPT